MERPPGVPRPDRGGSAARRLDPLPPDRAPPVRGPQSYRVPPTPRGGGVGQRPAGGRRTRRGAAPPDSTPGRLRRPAPGGAGGCAGERRRRRRRGGGGRWSRKERPCDCSGRPLRPGKGFQLGKPPPSPSLPPVPRPEVDLPTSPPPSYVLSPTSLPTSLSLSWVVYPVSTSMCFSLRPTVSLPSVRLCGLPTSGGLCPTPSLPPSRLYLSLSSLPSLPFGPFVCPSPSLSTTFGCLPTSLSL